jgi:hypothetical protein
VRGRMNFWRGSHIAYEILSLTRQLLLLHLSTKTATCHFASFHINIISLQAGINFNSKACKINKTPSTIVRRQTCWAGIDMIFYISNILISFLYNKIIPTMLILLRKKLNPHFNPLLQNPSHSGLEMCREDAPDASH